MEQCTRVAVLALIAHLAGPVAQARDAPSPWAGDVLATLELAGDNRSELERVLAHSLTHPDPQRIMAAEFLIANMADQGYITYGLYAGDEKVVFDALGHEDYKKALAELERIESERPGVDVDFRKDGFIPDAEVITADFLIENIDAAFEAWKGYPWAKGISFDAFCNHILPYRASNEPLEPWRRDCMARLSSVIVELGDDADLAAAHKQISKEAGHWIRFNEVFYLHPTDQGWSEMHERKLGRCEDITNMSSYALRAAAVPVASDYTPAWANRDNNHAWPVGLDADGTGRAGLSNVAAKIYRKTFAIQRDSLAAIAGAGAELPRWLSGAHFVDVTAQYMETVDVPVVLSPDAVASHDFAYLCVFNGGEWVPIDWARIEKGATPRATFRNVGRAIVVLPALYEGGQVVPAAPPVIIHKDGALETLDGGHGGSEVTQLEITTTVPEIPDADTESVKPSVKVKPGEVYTLYVWEDGWQFVGQRTAGDEPVDFTDGAASGRLHWLVREGGRKLERIFTVDTGSVQHW